MVLTKTTDDTDDTCFALFVACVLGSLVYEFADSHRACNLCVVNEFKFYSYMFNDAAAQGKKQKEGQEDQGTLKQPGGVPLALSPLHPPLGLSSGSLLSSLAIHQAIHIVSARSLQALR